MVARGEREARSPWNVREKKYRPGRPTETGQSICRPSGARAFFICDPGAACSLRSHLPRATIYRACGAQHPGPSSAPAALRNPGPSTAPAALRNPGPSSAPAALRNPGCHLPRLRRCGTPAHLPRLRRCGTPAHLARLRRFGTLRAPPARTNNDVNSRVRRLASAAQKIKGVATCGPPPDCERNASVLPIAWSIGICRLSARGGRRLSV
jgi:hypothetical protein